MYKITRIFRKNINKAHVFSTISDETRFHTPYFTFLILSIIIATFGLILNNVAIIIGSMILSPLMWPIIGIALGTVMGSRKMLYNSLGLLIISIFVIIICSSILGLFSPFSSSNSEILSRINPTIFDLLIALAAGFAAPLVLIWYKFSSSTAGVAIAASLLPPIAVTGIQLSKGQFTFAYGSFLLFLTNLACIIFAGIIIFSLAGFYNHEDVDQTRTVKYSLVASLIVLITLGIQLTFSLQKIIHDQITKSTIENILKVGLEKIQAKAEIYTIRTTSPSNTPNSTLNIDATLYTPSNFTVLLEEKNELIESLEKTLQRDVSLELRFIPAISTVDAEPKDTASLRSLKKQIELLTLQYFSTTIKDTEIESINVQPTNAHPVSYDVVIKIRLPLSAEMNKQHYEELKNLIKMTMKATFSFKIYTTYYSAIGDIDSKGSITEQNILQAINEYTAEKETSGIRIKDISYTESNDAKNLKLSMSLHIPTSVPQEIISNYIRELKFEVIQAKGIVNTMPLVFDINIYKYENFTP